MSQQTFYSSLLPLDKDAKSWFARMVVQPSGHDKFILNTFIQGIKSDHSISSLSQLFDGMWITGIHEQTAARLNVLNSSFTLVNGGGSVPWSAYKGFSSDGTLWLDTGLNIQNNTTAFSLNSGSIGSYNRRGAIVEDKLGCIDSSGGNWTHIGDDGNFNFDTAINNGGDGTPGTYPADLKGLVSVKRINSTTKITQQRTTILENNISSVSESKINGNLYILASNDIGNGNIPQLFSTDEISFAYIGSGNIDFTKLYNRVQTMFSSFGTQV